MPIETLDRGYLVALHNYLIAEAELDGPMDISLTARNFHLGRFQASPEDKAPVITLHVGNPVDPASSGSQDWRHELIDGSQEMAGGACYASQWFYRYTVQIQYFMTRTGEKQDAALDKASRLTQWLSSHISKATPWVLNKISVDPLVWPSAFNETPMETLVMAIETQEGGGPSQSYIHRATIFIEQRVLKGATT